MQLIEVPWQCASPMAVIYEPIDVVARLLSNPTYLVDMLAESCCRHVCLECLVCPDRFRVYSKTPHLLCVCLKWRDDGVMGLDRITSDAAYLRRGPSAPPPKQTKSAMYSYTYQ